jgi:hypothetical protein
MAANDSENVMHKITAVLIAASCFVAACGEVEPMAVNDSAARPSAHGPNQAPERPDTESAPPVANAMDELAAWPIASSRRAER